MKKTSWIGHTEVLTEILEKNFLRKFSEICAN